MFRLTRVSRMHLFRRVMVREFGGPQHLLVEDFHAKDLAVGHDEVLVRNSFAGVNFIDAYYRSGLYKKPQGLPLCLGEEGAGAIMKVGSSVDPKRLSQRVAYFTTVSGSYSSFVTLKADDAFPIPDAVSDATAAAVMLQGCTAHYLCNSVRGFPVGKGDVVLIHAAAGGTGLLLSQMCKANGALVIGTCGGAEKAKIATRIGKVDVVIDYNAQTPANSSEKAAAPWVAQVRQEAHRLSQGSRDACDIVFDGVGLRTFYDSLGCLRTRGSMVSFGNASGPVPAISPLTLTQYGSVSLHRPSLKHFSSHAGGEIETRVADVFQMIANESLHVSVGKVFPMHNARDAHEFLEGRLSNGKVLLNCQE